MVPAGVTKPPNTTMKRTIGAHRFGDPKESHAPLAADR
jgi:hypothetical protein